jgi:DnaJ homolog subfamily A member 2
MRFKAVSQAYEILYDDEKRHLYDTHGMSAFDPARGSGMGGDVDFDDILSHMFGMGMGGPPPPGFGGGPMRPRKGRDEEKKYEVTLEELYKGKTTKFASTKNVVCSACKGNGGKEKAKPKTCATCHGRGVLSR